MLIEKAVVEETISIAKNIFLIKVKSPQIADKALPGQFCNIKITENNFPLLRRPFSISNVESDVISFLFDVHGKGTKILSQKEKGNVIDILGPLGNGFCINDDFEIAIILSGGIGVAAFPFLIKRIANKKIYSFVGSRNKENLITQNLPNTLIATDDGSVGFKGNVLELFIKERKNIGNKKIKIFACGPTPMLKAVQQYAIKEKLLCEISAESAMACGFGICQGCVVEGNNSEKYKLICADGPVFNAEEVEL